MSAHELWLRVPRNVIAERGFGVTHLPRDRAAYLTGTGWTIDPLSGYLCPRVKADLTGSLAFADVTSDYSACAPFMVSDGTYPAALSHTAAAAFTVEGRDQESGLGGKNRGWDAASHDQFQASGRAGSGA